MLNILKYEEIFLVALLALAISPASAKRQKNIVEVHTSCGKTAHIDTSRGSMEQVIEQVMLIEEVLCG